MIFSELLHCACGRLSHLYDEFKQPPESTDLEKERKARAYIEGQIGFVKLTRRYNHPPPSQPLADLPVALNLLDRILRIEWQGEGARLSARDALAHPFFAGKAEQPVGQGCLEEQRRFAGVRTRLQQLHEVRCCAFSRAFFWHLIRRVRSRQESAEQHDEACDGQWKAIVKACDDISQTSHGAGSF